MSVKPLEVGQARFRAEALGICEMFCRGPGEFNTPQQLVDGAPLSVERLNRTDGYVGAPEPSVCHRNGRRRPWAQRTSVGSDLFHPLLYDSLYQFLGQRILRCEMEGRTGNCHPFQLFSHRFHQWRAHAV